MLKESNCDTIVTMVNSICDYSDWENILGKGRILPAFPGAGGSIENRVLKAEFTPFFLQPTTFGEIHGTKTKRSMHLKKILKSARIPV